MLTTEPLSPVALVKILTVFTADVVLKLSLTVAPERFHMLLQTNLRH